MNWPHTGLQATDQWTRQVRWLRLRVATERDPVTGKDGQGCNLRRLIDDGDGEPGGLDPVLEPDYCRLRLPLTILIDFNPFADAQLLVSLACDRLLWRNSEELAPPSVPTKPLVVETVPPGPGT